ncbi:hypothetical protein [Mesorhizobium sp. KR9-304]|uniref:hypothetical protein n=1 Tax=Mesorhizobium sp. KR9-304 TaxID=3156614 RepID=UPI0032B4D441
MVGTLHNGIWVRTDRDWIRYDASQTMEPYASPIRLLWGAAAVLVGLAAAAWTLANDDTPPIVYLCARAGIVGCLFVLVLILVRALAIRRPIITLPSDGFLDVRISSAVIPWRLIQEISERTIASSSLRDSKALFLYLPASSWKNLPLKRLVRWMLPLILKRTHGHEGLCIGHGEFGMSFDTFRDVVTAYAEARGVTVN